MDDDLQNPPEEIPRLLARLEEGFDVVYGAPNQRQHGFWRDLGSGLTRLTLKPLIGSKNARNVSSFRVFRAHVRQAFAQFQGPYVSLDVLLTWGTGNFSSSWCSMSAASQVHPPIHSSKLASHALDMLTGFSTWPLRVASLIGLTFTVFGFLILVYVLASYIINRGSLPGFPFLASIISIFLEPNFLPSA